MKLFQLEFDWNRRQSDDAHFVEVAGQTLSIVYQRSFRARRYRLFVDEDGRPRVTIPRRGTQREAERFVRQHRDWLIRELGRANAHRGNNPWWRVGGEFLRRGEFARLENIGGNGAPCLRLGSETLVVPRAAQESDEALRAWVEGHLRKWAKPELIARVTELANEHNSPVRRVSIRNQRSRWGSCSRTGTISLNWRLVQAPVAVRDYVIVHELMHLREMNHSSRFWKLVAEACPTYRQCEAWLRQFGGALR